MKQHMNGYIIKLLQPVSCRDTGKFEAPSPLWKHDTLSLDDTYELFVVVKGTLYLNYQNVSYSIHEGQFLLIEPHDPPNNLRKGYNNCACDFYWLHFFPPKEIRESDLSEVDFSYLEESHEIFIPKQGSLFYPDKIAIYMRQLQDTIRSDYSFLSINYLTSVILCEISNQFRMSKDVQDLLSHANRGIYNSIIDFIDENFDKDLQLKTIARKFNYNEQYVARLFKSFSDISLHQYIINRRIEEANFYLAETSLSVKDISQKIGYTDSHNFMKLYKRETGMTPSEYRNSFPNRLRYES